MQKWKEAHDRQAAQLERAKGNLQMLGSRHADCIWLLVTPGEEEFLGLGVGTQKMSQS